MGRKHAKVISRDAFIQSFVEAEVVMRRNLAARIAEAASDEVNEDFQAGMMKARQIVLGITEETSEDIAEDAVDEIAGESE